MAYHDPVYSTYTLPASAIATAGTKLTVAGPRGKVGRLVAIAAALTAATTGAATELRVGTAGTADKYGTLSVPVSAIGTAHNNATLAAADANLMPADEAVVIASDGGSTAGDADLAITIAWF